MNVVDILWNSKRPIQAINLESTDPLDELNDLIKRWGSASAFFDGGHLFFKLLDKKISSTVKELHEDHVVIEELWSTTSHRH